MPKILIRIPVGNGTYLVKMRLKKDMPNWVPMYGRKVCFIYRGIKKQCNSCFIYYYCTNLYCYVPPIGAPNGALLSNEIRIMDLDLAKHVCGWWCG